MKTTHRFLALLIGASLLQACGDEGDSYAIEPILPNEECPAGGQLLTLNGDSHVVCNDAASSVRVETIAADAEGNPCGSESKRVTVEMDGESSISWICGQDDVSAPNSFALLDGFEFTHFHGYLTYVNQLLCEHYEDYPEASPHRSDHIFAVSLLKIEPFSNAVRLCLDQPGNALRFPELSEPVLEALECERFGEKRKVCVIQGIHAAGERVCGADYDALILNCEEQFPSALNGACIAELTESELAEFEEARDEIADLEDLFRMCQMGLGLINQ